MVIVFWGLNWGPLFWELPSDKGFQQESTGLLPPGDFCTAEPAGAKGIRLGHLESYLSQVSNGFFGG